VATPVTSSGQGQRAIMESIDSLRVRNWVSSSIRFGTRCEKIRASKHWSTSTATV